MVPDRLPTDNKQPDIYDAYDREYGLSDLLPAAFLDRLCGAVCGALPMELTVILPGGAVYYNRGEVCDEEFDFLNRHTMMHPVANPVVVDGPLRQLSVFPLRHELETIGYLAVWHVSNGHSGAEEISSGGLLLHKLICVVAEMKQKLLMTAGIHGQVVTDAYETIQQKMRLVEQSEEKYRLLAGRLELEVERKTEQIKIAQARLLQHEKQAAVGQLAAGVAHEINNPLGFVKSNLAVIRQYLTELCDFARMTRPLTEALKTDPKGSDVRIALKNMEAMWSQLDLNVLLEDANQVVSETRSGIDRIGKIVDRLKIFSAVDAPGELFTDIRDCIDCAISVLDTKLLERIAIRRDYGDIPLVKCRRDDINHVFLNLFTNAVQAIETDGEISVRTRFIAGEKPFVEITVGDNGGGVAPENLGRIFEPFFTTRNVGQGMGLGLYAAYTIIRNHGGEIDVQSRPGEGAMFAIKLFTG